MGGERMGGEGEGGGGNVSRGGCSLAFPLSSLFFFNDQM